MKVRLSGSARTYLRQETIYLRQHSRSAADAFVARIANARDKLSRFPDIGLGTDRLPIKASRRLIVGDYLIDYDLDADGIVINSIRHAAQRPLPIDDDSDQ